MSIPRRYQALRHPLFYWFGLRPIFAQHTQAEHKVLQRWASGRHRLVEIGVAEGGSAYLLRQVMAPDGTLYLIDPFHLGRLKWLRSLKRAAQGAVNMSDNGNVVWIEKFSTEAGKDWTGEIDLLFLDGDHSEQGVWQDWHNWHRFVVPGGVVIFHDARVFPGGWTDQHDGPVKLVNTIFREQQIDGWEIVEEVHSVVVVQRKQG
jgi:predicted O-methyltransferase YrrM